MKQEIRTDKAPAPSGPYSQGLRAGSRVYVAGQRPSDPVTGIIPDSFAGQAKLVMENVRHVLEAGGASMNDVVQVRVFLTDLANFAAFNEVYAAYFTPPFPVRTTVKCELRGIMVEVDAVAEILG